MAQRTPVIVNGQCEVLVEHVKASGSGLVYRGADEFIKAIGSIAALGKIERERQGDQARNYVLENYSRDEITTRLMAEVEALAAG